MQLPCLLSDIFLFCKFPAQLHSWIYTIFLRFTAGGVTAKNVVVWAPSLLCPNQIWRSKTEQILLRKELTVSYEPLAVTPAEIKGPAQKLILGAFYSYSFRLSKVVRLTCIFSRFSYDIEWLQNQPSRRPLNPVLRWPIRPTQFQMINYYNPKLFLYIFIIFYQFLPVAVYEPDNQTKIVCPRQSCLTMTL